MYELTLSFDSPVDVHATLERGGIEYLESNDERTVVLFGGEVLRLTATPSVAVARSLEIQVWDRPTSDTEDWEGLLDRFEQRVSRLAVPAE